MPETVPCNLCGADDAKALFTLRDYRLQVDDREWTAVRCRQCGLGYLNPRPAPSELPAYYPPEYFDARRQDPKRHQRMAQYVRRPERRHAGNDGDRHPSAPRILDIGTAQGTFLTVMQEDGWAVEGIEPSEAAGNPFNLLIHRCPFPERCDLPPDSFDVVTAWAVFEHLRDPKAAFRAAANLVRPGGELIVQVPNLRSIASRLAMQEDVPRHLYFFDRQSLERYGRLAGLELTEFHHTTDLFGGTGQGALRYALVRGLGRTKSEFFEIHRTSPPRKRLRRWPVLGLAWSAASALERVVLAPVVVRKLRLSGQVVVRYSKPPREPKSSEPLTGVASL